jgi:hypothetical protein
MVYSIKNRIINFDELVQPMKKGKIQQLFTEKYKLKEKLEKDWQYFIYRDTYLIFEEKQKFFKESN